MSSHWLRNMLAVGLIASLFLLYVAQPAVAGGVAGQSAERADSTQAAGQAVDGIERSMLVTGVIEIDAAGLVQRYTIGHRDRLPHGVTRLIDSRVPLWAFEPADLPERQNRTVSKMGLRPLAYRTAEDQYTLRLRSASFQAMPEDEVRTDRLALTGRPYLDCPPGAGSVDVSAIACVALRIDPEGKVTDAVTHQVDLRASGSDAELDNWRGVFAREARRHAMRMSFTVPTTGPDAGDGPRTGTLPMDYSMSKEMRGDIPGRWDVYRPGPIHEIPWQQASSAAAAAAAGPAPGARRPTPDTRHPTPPRRPGCRIGKNTVGCVDRSIMADHAALGAVHRRGLKAD